MSRRPTPTVSTLVLAFAAGAALAADQPAGSFDILLRYATFDPVVREPAPPAELAADPASLVRIVQFTSAPTQGARDLVAAAGGVVHHFLGNHALIVRVDEAGAAQLRAQPAVRWVGPFHAAYRLEEPLIAGIQLDGLPRPTRYSILLLEPGERADVVRRIEALGGRVDWAGDPGPRLEATLTGPQLLGLAHEDGVLFIDRWAPAMTYMDIVRQAGGANYLESVAGYRGEGVRGEAQDTGLLLTHTDWQAIPPILHGANGSSLSHGTSVFGIVFGQGVSNPMGRGLLPQGQGIFAASNLNGRRTHLTELVNAPYEGVFQTNSWGQCCTTQYTTQAADMDGILFDIGLLLLQAQANEGNQNSDFIAYGKNLVSVGATIHNNTLNRGDDRHNGAAGSTGPAADGRIKPDLCFWYDNIFTTSSSSPSSYTSGFGGTSAATPTTAGHFGLMFQMWDEGIFGNDVNPGGTVFENRPQMATAKAMMVNTANPYPFSGPTADLRRVRQGWGMADVQRLYDMRDLYFIVDEEEPLQHGQFVEYDVDVLPGQAEFRATMVYTDPPGVPNSNRHRVNDLTLEAISPGGVAYFGNNGMLEGNVTTPGGAPNTVDTVENVWVTNPEAGPWTVRIRADEVVTDAHVQTPQIDADFALVVSGGVGRTGIGIRIPGGAPSALPPGEPTDIDVIILPGGDTLIQGSAMLHYRHDPNDPFTAVPLVHQGGDNYIGTIPGPTCTEEPEYYFSARGVSSGLRTNPSGAPGNAYHAIAGAMEAEDLINADFTGGLPAGWTRDGLWAANSNCAPSGTCGGGTWLYYGVPAQCNYNNGARNMGVAASPVIDLPTLPWEGSITLTYCSAKVSENACPFDCAEVYFNGVRIDRPPESQAWVEREIDLTSFAGQSGRLEFRFDTGDGSRNNFRGWHVDNVKLSYERRACESGCYPDCDTSTGPGVLDIFDFLCFQNKFAAQDPYACDCDTSTGQGVCDIFDFTCFQNAYAAGCP